ncbi:MAG: hypothetical protein HC828_19885 [Blastochloris sp.]|nr:hypothetical protein [Blastochloris sp.]
MNQVRDALRDHPLTIDIAQNLPPVAIDVVLMEQALVNLLENAARHTPPGTPITVHAMRRDDALEIIVQDRGPGISPADLERVFEKFYRGQSSAAHGTGLGLSICKGLVEAHGGYLWAANLPSGGVRFTIHLPISQETL